MAYRLKIYVTWLFTWLFCLNEMPTAQEVLPGKHDENVISSTYYKSDEETTFKLEFRMSLWNCPLQEMRINFKNIFTKKKKLYMPRQIIFSTYFLVQPCLTWTALTKTPTLLTNSSSISQAVSPNNQSNKVQADQLATVLQVAFSIIAGSAHL